MALFRRRKEPEKPILVVSCNDEFAMEVKGESYHQEAIQELVAASRIEQTSPDACHCEFPVIVFHERKNAYDANAVAVSSLTGVPLGHLPRQVAAQFAPVLDRIETHALVRCSARAYGRLVGRPHGWNFGIWLDLPTASELSEAIGSLDPTALGEMRLES
jgi:hypothetical protein